MTINNNHYLSQFITDKDHNLVGNEFFSIAQASILNAEKRLDYKFPSQLKNFYQTIGSGFLVSKYDTPDVVCGYSNRIMDPESIADVLLEGYDSGQLHPEAQFIEGDMPFFEIGEGRDFFVMRPKTDNPNAVYDMFGSLIEDSFERFIWLLYYESPTFYLNY